MHDERVRPLNATYDLAARTATVVHESANATFSASGDVMDIALAGYGPVRLEGGRDMSNFGAGEVVLRTVGTAPTSCRTLKLCAAPFALDLHGDLRHTLLSVDLHGHARRTARAVLPLGLAMFRHAEYAAEC